MKILDRAGEYQVLEQDVGFEILAAVNMKSMVFWVATPCSLARAQCF
jgi:hypothetical protein